MSYTTRVSNIQQLTLYQDWRLLEPIKRRSRTKLHYMAPLRFLDQKKRVNILYENEAIGITAVYANTKLMRTEHGKWLITAERFIQKHATDSSGSRRHVVGSWITESTLNNDRNWFLVRTALNVKATQKVVSTSLQSLLSSNSHSLTSSRHSGKRRTYDAMQRE